MNVFVRIFRNIILGCMLAVGIPAVADDFSELSIYNEVSVEDEPVPDPEVAHDIVDAIGEDADLPPEKTPEAQVNPSDYRFSNATPEPEYDPAMSAMANKFAKKKVVKKAKKLKTKKMAKAKSKAKKAKGKKRTLARN